MLVQSPNQVEERASAAVQVAEDVCCNRDRKHVKVIDYWNLCRSKILFMQLVEVKIQWL
jgi:hypothetical protein